MKSNGPRLVRKVFKLYLIQNPAQLMNVHLTIDHTIRFLFNTRSRVDGFVPFINFLAAFCDDANTVIGRGFFEMDEGNWWSFLVPFIRMQLYVSDANSSSIAIVPLYNREKHCIILDTAALFAVYNSTRSRGNKIERQYRGMKPYVWAHAFYLYKFAPNRHHQFHYMVRTNGTEFSYVFKNPFLNTEPAEIAFGEFDFPQNTQSDDGDWEMQTPFGDHDDDDDVFFEQNPYFSEIQSEYLQEKIPRVGSIDWGGKYFISANIKQGDTETLMFLHSAKYHRLAEYKKNKRDSDKLKKFDMDNEKSLRLNCLKQFELVPSNTNRHYLHFTLHRLKLYKICQRQFVDNKIPRLRLRQYQLKQKNFEKILNELHGGQVTLIFVGVNPFSGTFTKGYIPCPINEFIHAMLCCNLIIVVFVDEFCTSKSCSFCVRKSIEFFPGKRHVMCKRCFDSNTKNTILPPAALVRKFEMCKNKTNTPFKRPVRGDRRNRIMDRDDNSTRCIMTVGLARMKGVAKPDCFRRQ